MAVLIAHSSRGGHGAAILLVVVALSAVMDAQTTAAVIKVVGDRHKLVLRGDGTVVGWGMLDNGQLGPVAEIPSARNRAAALVSIALPAKAIDVAAGDATSYALLEDGTVVAWGRGDSGELGNGAAGTTAKLPRGSPGSERPVTVIGLEGVTQVVAYGHTALALLKDGTVRAWGARGSGMVGDGLHPKRYGESGPPALSPVRVPNVSGVTQLAAGSEHVLALTADGRVLAWGSNYHGALGREPRQEIPIDRAAEVTGLIEVTAVAGGLGVSSAVKKDGTVWVWGANWHSQFGNGERTGPPGITSGYQLVPQQVPGVTTVAAIAMGLSGRHTLVLLKDGTLRGWGNTDWGQIGAGVSGTFQAKPVIPKIAGVKAVFAAGNNSFAVKADGSLWMWGGGGADEWPLPANTKTPVPMELK